MAAVAIKPQDEPCCRESTSQSFIDRSPPRSPAMMKSILAALITSSARRRSDVVPGINEDHVSDDLEELSAAAGTPGSSPTLSHYHTAINDSFCHARSSTSSIPSVTNDPTLPEEADVLGSVVLNEEGVEPSTCNGDRRCDVIATRKPHHANEARWAAVQAVQKSHGALGPHHFEFRKKLGHGEIGELYLAELCGTESIFAVKVVNREELAKQKKLSRAQTECEILQDLDHPFLPTLYSHFDFQHYTCLVMDFCPGGDLNSLRLQQHRKCFSESSTRFYVSEVLLALEYLHMEGIVYRDLKPENVLVREDGHIVLADFDLSLRFSVSPTLVEARNLDEDYCKNPGYQVQSSRTVPTCIPSCLLPPCFSSGLSKKNRKQRQPIQAKPLLEHPAEPRSVRSMSILGRREYLAPEIIKGVGHGSSFDWWTLGIFLYELLYGKTPFKGNNAGATLLKFPEFPAVSFAAKDLIRGLLVKDPEGRLGCKRGVTEIKQHPFFQGMNWALVRNTRPMYVPEPFEIDQSGSSGDLLAGSGGDVSDT